MYLCGFVLRKSCTNIRLKFVDSASETAHIIIDFRQPRQQCGGKRYLKILIPVIWTTSSWFQLIQPCTIILVSRALACFPFFFRSNRWPKDRRLWGTRMPETTLRSVKRKSIVTPFRRPTSNRKSSLLCNLGGVSWWRFLRIVIGQSISK